MRCTPTKVTCSAPPSPRRNPTRGWQSQNARFDPSYSHFPTTELYVNRTLSVFAPVVVRVGAEPPSNEKPPAVLVQVMIREPVASCFSSNRIDCPSFGLVGAAIVRDPPGMRGRAVPRRGGGERRVDGQGRRGGVRQRTGRRQDRAERRCDGQAG